MKTFILAMVILIGLETVVSLIVLGWQLHIPRTFPAMAMGLIGNVTLIVWACVLLWGKPGGGL